jgi:hypothetical protein
MGRLPCGASRGGTARHSTAPQQGITHTAGVHAAAQAEMSRMQPHTVYTCLSTMHQHRLCASVAQLHASAGSTANIICLL